MNIESVGPEAFEAVSGLVAALLSELGDEGADAGVLDYATMRDAWRANSSTMLAFVARADDGSLVGLMTLTEAFAIYANGPYGIISELYVAPAARSQGTGEKLLAHAASIGRERGWQRIDVTAPESDRWSRTIEFYKRNGFVYAGPKLKLNLR